MDNTNMNNGVMDNAHMNNPSMNKRAMNATHMNNGVMDNGSKGVTLWFTGLSGSGKTTIAREVALELRARGRRTEILDGDIVRKNLSKGLGFSKEDRDTNVRRIGFVANLLSRNGIVAITAAISPYRAVRDDVRMMTDHFIEIYVRAPLEVCEARDVKGLYAMARAGEIKGFTGIDDPYEEPVNPDIICDTDRESVEQSAEKVINALERRDFLSVREAVLF